MLADRIPQGVDFTLRIECREAAPSGTREGEYSTRTREGPRVDAKTKMQRLLYQHILPIPPSTSGLSRGE